MLCYKIKLGQKLDIETIRSVFAELSNELQREHILLTEDNVESAEIDEVISVEGHSEPILRGDDKFDYLEGQLTVARSGNRSDYFQKFKQIVLLILEKQLGYKVDKVMLQEGDMITEKWWVEIE